MAAKKTKMKVWAVDYSCSVSGTYYVQAKTAARAKQYVETEKDADELFDLCADGSRYGGVEVMEVAECDRDVPVDHIVKK